MRMRRERVQRMSGEHSLSRRSSPSMSPSRSVPRPLGQYPSFRLQTTRWCTPAWRVQNIIIRAGFLNKTSMHLCSCHTWLLLMDSCFYSSILQKVCIFIILKNQNDFKWRYYYTSTCLYMRCYEVLQLYPGCKLMKNYMKTAVHKKHKSCANSEARQTSDNIIQQTSQI